MNEFDTMQKIIDEEGKSNINIISTFAGGGGSSTGYRMAGGKILLVNEFVDMAVETYKANYPNAKVLKGDIRDMSPDDFLKNAGIEKHELDLFDGSPPCSAFSVAGKIDKGWGKEKSYSTGKEQVVDDLFFQYSRILKGIMPKVFVAENVKGLILGKSRGYFNDIISDLRNNGYYVEAKILNSSHFGVPQNRERLFFIGVRNDIMKEEYKKHLHPRATVKKKTSIREALKDKNIIKNDKVKISGKTLRLWENTAQGDCFGKAHNKLYGKTSLFLHRRLSRNFPSPTATTTRDLYHHSKPRRIYNDELKIIMGLPLDYKNKGSISVQWERLARMVTPQVTEAILSNLISIGVFNGK